MTELIEALNPPVADRGTGSVRTGTPVSRVDGRAKVTGQAKYAAELPAPDLAYGVVVSSPAAKGRIVAIDTQAALAVPGVVEVLTHLNRPKIRSFDIAYKDMTAPAGSPFRPLYDDRVMYSGQPLALVVAETFEAARYAASLVRFEIDTEPHGTKLSANLERAYKPKPLKAGYEPPPDEKGNTDAAYAQAPVKIDAEFYSGVEHHNPMELFASTVIRDPSGHLTIYDKTQSSQNSRWYVSHVFGLSKNKVTVRNPYVGGAFGSGLRPQYQLTLAVMAALHLKRSVRVVLTRQQMFSFGHRPETVQRVKLAADNDGTLRAIWHQAIAETSPIEDYVEVVVNWSGMLYQCDNIKLDYKLVKLDHYTPIDMRAPGAAHGVHALEVAMDELAWELKMDPLALRLKNYAERSPVEDKPYSSKELRACYELAAKKIWLGPAAAESPLDARGHRVDRLGHGHRRVGCDADVRPRQRGAARGRQAGGVQRGDRHRHRHLHRDGDDRRRSARPAAGRRDVPAGRLDVAGGADRGGSSHVTTVGSAVAGVCEKLQKTLFKHAKALSHSPFANTRFKDVEFTGGALRLKRDPQVALPLAAIMNDSGVVRLEEKYLMLPNMLKQRKFRRLVHSAVFVEVRVDEQTGVVRVTRVTSAVAAGRIMNLKTATSQVVGGIVWGISQALHEETYADHRLGRFMNHNYAEYHVPVNADIHAVDVIFAEEDDRIVSRLGAKGVGEIGIVGVAAAVSNAIWHATGKRLRSTPMTPDKVLGGGP